MSDLNSIPRQDKFSTRLATKLQTTATTVELNTAPDFTISGSDVFYIVVNAGTTKHQIVKCNALSGTTATVDTLAMPIYEGGTGTAFEQPAGSPVIITNTWQTFADIKTAVNSKVDDAGDTMTGLLQFSGTDHAGIRLISLTTAERTALTPADGDLVFDTDDALPYVYYNNTWNSVDTGTTTPNASTTVAGKVEIATQAEADAGTSTGGTGASLVTSPDITAVAVQNSTWSYAADAEASDTYAITLSPAPSAYASGQFFMFKANTANTGAATLNVNSLGAVTIKKAQNEDLETGDIKAGQLVCVGHDGTNFQLMSPSAASASITSSDIKFGGDGSDGALDTSSSGVAIDLAGSSYVVKNYTSMNIVTNDLTFTSPNSEGTTVVLKCQGDLTLSSSIIADFGAAGGAGGAITTDGSAGSDNDNIIDTSDHFGTGGDGGDSSSVSNAGGSGEGDGGLILTKTGIASIYATQKHKMIYVVPGSGGAGGGGGGNSDNGAPNGPGATGGAGGRGGGALIIEVGGDINFTGTIDASGTDGTDGNDSVTAASQSSGGGGGGGGGGSGGMVVVLYNTSTATSGTIDVSGGAGGAGGSAGTTSVSSSGSAGGGGQGGGGGGFYAAAGGTGGAGGAGGGGTGVSGTAGTSGASSTSGAGGAGGSGGSGAGTNGGGGGGGGGGSNGISLLAVNTEF